MAADRLGPQEGPSNVESRIGEGVVQCISSVDQQPHSCTHHRVAPLLGLGLDVLGLGVRHLQMVACLAEELDVGDSDRALASMQPLRRKVCAIG